MDPDHPPIVVVNVSPPWATSPPQSTIHRAGRHGAHRPVGALTQQPGRLLCRHHVDGLLRRDGAGGRAGGFNVAAAARCGGLRQRTHAKGEPVHGYEIDEHARIIISRADFIRHRTGHSLGSDIHYRGVNIDNLETQDRRRLIPGVMFTVGWHLQPRCGVG
ncbi:MAG: M24 family metallopeptidase [Caldilineaceae bacterium]